MLSKLVAHFEGERMLREAPIEYGCNCKNELEDEREDEDDRS